MIYTNISMTCSYDNVYISLFFSLVYVVVIDEVKSLSVVEGESVTLHTYINEDQIQTDTVIQWTFNNEIIAKLQNRKVNYEDVLDKKFNRRLKLDEETGSLSISNFKSDDAGLYEVKIINITKILNFKFNVFLTERTRSVKFTESVTLDTCVTEIEEDEEIRWMFEEMPLAEYIGGSDKPTIFNSDERFKDKLEVNHQTGNLTIRNIRTEVTGLYKVQIKNNNRTKYRKVNVALIVHAVKGENFTLSTKVKIEKGDKVEWTLKDKTTLVTRDKGDDSKPLYTDTLRFRNRLGMIPETGDLTIKNIRQSDEGIYKLQLIKTDGKIKNRIFKIDVIGKGSQQSSEKIKTAKFAESVTLDSSVAKIQKDDEILWMYGEIPLAHYIGGNDESTLYDYIDQRFKYRLEVNLQTGDLTIRNIRAEHSGVYKLQIKNSYGTKDRRFNVALNVRVINGESAVLSTKIKVKEGDEVQWTSKDKTILVSVMNGDNNETSFIDNVRYKDRLEMIPETGDLMITNINETDGGVYKLQVIHTNGKITNRIFNLNVIDNPYENIQKKQDLERSRTAKFAGSVTLETGINKIQKDDEILWMFEDIHIAHYIGGSDNPTIFNTDERFKYRLQLNHQNGNLTIRNIRTELTGRYKVQIKNSSGTKDKTMNVALNVDAVKGRPLTLFTKVTIEDVDKVEWTSEDKTILVIKSNGESNETSYTDDVKYRNRLEMKPETGDLTIINIRQSDDVVYKLQLIKTDGKIINRIFNVNFVAKAQVNFLNQQNSERIDTKLSESVTLYTGVAQVQRDDEILWMFGDIHIAQFMGCSNESTLHNYTDERFKDRLEVNDQTGDLIIRNIGFEHNGVYKVQIKNSNETKDREIEVALQMEAVKEENVVLPTKLTIEEGDEVKWTLKDKTIILFGMNGDNNETSYTDDEKYRNRLRMTAKTGDLKITNIRETDAGVYKLQLIKTDGKITNRIFNVYVVESARNDVIVELTPLLQQPDYNV